MRSPFERHTQQALCLLDPIRILSGNIPEEGVNGGKPDVACGNTIVSVSLQMSEKCKEDTRSELTISDLRALGAYVLLSKRGFLDDAIRNALSDLIRIDQSSEPFAD